MTAETRTDGSVLRQGQEVSLSDLDDERTHRFVVIESDGRDVTARSPSRLRMPFPAGAEVRVRYSVLDDASYEGSVVLTGAADDSGCPEYAFRLPEDMVRLQARNFRRLALLAEEVTVTLTPVGGTGRACQGQVIDISAGGIGVMLGDEIDVGESYRIQCSIGAGSLDLDVQGDVVRASDEGGQYGLRFTGVRPAVEDKIVAFVLRQSLQRG